LRRNLDLTFNSQEQEEPNDSEVEPGEDFQPSKVKETATEGESETKILTASSSADEEAVNKVAEKIDTLRMGPRQVKQLSRLP
jgi:ABC-type Mn2+/Zn2+ transport system ATPase subunit